MAKDSKAQTTKVKKKKWITVKAPKMLNEAVIGDVPVYDDAFLIGKTMPANMMTLTGDVKKQSITMKFLITDIKEGVANTLPVSLEVSQSVIKRHVRRGKDRIDESLVLKTKDDVKVRIKVMAVTNTKTKSSVLKALRHKMVKETHAYLLTKNFEEMFSEILGVRIQKAIKEKLGKIYPTRIVEVRSFKKENDKVKLSKLSTKEEKKKEPKDQEWEEEEKTSETQEIAKKIKKEEKEEQEDADN